ncbi:MAG: N-6 DNA methylase [Prevotellaceae bacterium]|jgi:Alw26I/Eco31I/Esp3I family type II restriction m6 adenine DNA methyltransferase|nr:N-6 DNA methylase [Prevotellaceae bacterium]
MNLQFLLLHEEKLIQSKINRKFENEINNAFGVPTEKVTDLINTELCDTESGIACKVHNKLICSLIFTYLSAKGFGKEILQNNFECSEKVDYSAIENINIQNIPTLCEELHITFLNSKFEYQKGKFVRVKSKNNLIEKGAVYTRPNIVKEIVETTIANYAHNNSGLSNVKVLDFACGTGRFYENIVSVLHSKYHLPKDDIILKNTFAIDIDPIALNITRLKAISFLSKITEEGIKQISKNILLRNALIRGGMFSEDNALKENDFVGLHNGQFDIVVSNPPYLVLKINKDKEQSELYAKIQKQVAYFRNSGSYHYSVEGMLNYYQLSIEAILSMVKPNGEIGIICPTSLFADISATKLRKHILLKHKLRGIKYFAEKEQLFENVTQATNIFYLQKAGSTNSIEVEESGNKFSVELSLVKQLFAEKMEIPFITETEWSVLKKISDKKKLKQIQSVRNRRGELDLTLYKRYITNQKTSFRLVRGNMISETGIKNINSEFVVETFIQAKSDDFVKNDFRKKRLVCQQVSNAGLKKRLKFVFCDETDILGNSCNYLSGDESVLSKLNLILNSSLLNWRFKITSTNNHINNYELDELPIVDLQLIDENYKYQSQRELDEYVGKIYGLEQDELQFILQR